MLIYVKVSQITLQYSGCEKQGPTFSDLPNFNYQLRSSDSKLSFTNPRWSFNGTHCNIQFQLPADLSQSVLLYYKLTNFFQNHRRYVQSLDTDQLKGKAVRSSDLDSSTCKPLSTIDGKPIYPCGLIANSLFNGISPLHFRAFSLNLVQTQYQIRSSSTPPMVASPKNMFFPTRE